MGQFLRRYKLLLLLLFITLLAIFGGYKYYVNSQAPKLLVKTVPIERGKITATISATGSLSAVDNVDINSKITGRIVEVYVQENEHVLAGQKLLRLDDTTLSATQTQTAAKLQNALATYNRYLSLVNNGAIARSEYDTAEADYIVAKAAYEQATSNLNDTLIVSPIEGYVIGKPTPVGQTVSSGISSPQVLMSVANLDNMQIEVLVDESDIGQVVVGQQVEFSVDSYPDVTFNGVVRLVSKSAVTVSNVIYYTVYVDVANAEGKLLPKMTARTELIVGAADNVLLVPTTCLRVDGSRKYVQIYDAATKETREVDVTVGLASDDKIAITGAVEEGQQVVTKAVKKTTGQARMGGPMH
ncbi:MAG: efflux RND transporter periplasmic adaptor subunit [Acidaminococcaceae bacterium]